MLQHIAKCDAFQGESSLQRFYLSLEPDLKLPSAKGEEDGKEKEAENSKNKEAGSMKEERTKNVKELLDKVRSALKAPATNPEKILAEA